MFTFSARSCKAHSRGARVLLSLALAVLVVPLLSSGAVAYEAQGDVAWYITGEELIDGEEYFVISMRADGAVFSSRVSFSQKYAATAATSVTPIGSSTPLSVRKATILASSVLSVPRDGFLLTKTGLCGFILIRPTLAGIRVLWVSRSLIRMFSL